MNSFSYASKLLKLCSISITLLGLSLTDPYAASLDDEHSKYTQIFYIYRNDIKVGQQKNTVTASPTREKLNVDMFIDIRFFGLNIFNFKYDSEEIWENESLISLSSKVNDDGELKFFSGKRFNNDFIVTTNKNSYVIFDEIYSTNHWRLNATKQDKILNTLTGKLNSINVINHGLENINYKGHKISATKYEYTGDLNKTFVWYDQNDLWVKLEFKARDGSTITYKCQTCVPSSEGQKYEK